MLIVFFHTIDTLSLDNSMFLDFKSPLQYSIFNVKS